MTAKFCNLFNCSNTKRKLILKSRCSYRKIPSPDISIYYMWTELDDRSWRYFLTRVSSEYNYDGTDLKDDTKPMQRI